MTERKLDKSQLTNPLTCVKCGRTIERGAALAWNRNGAFIDRFWHADECPMRRMHPNVPPTTGVWAPKKRRAK